jgi:hypothetical protein
VLLLVQIAVGECPVQPDVIGVVAPGQVYVAVVDPGDLPVLVDQPVAGVPVGVTDQ